jgi:hypothetical protein
MRRASLMLLWVLVGCEPHFESGKTQCSDRNECPSGFVCGNAGTGTRRFCFDRKIVGCMENAFYCALTNTCVSSSADCQTSVSGPGGNAGVQTGGATDPGAAGSGGSGATAVEGGNSATNVSTGGTPGTSSLADGGASSCTNPSYPMYCPATGDVQAGCWASGTACSTITSCSGVPKACSSANKKVFCGGPECCTPPAAGGSCSLPACGCPSGKVCYPDTPSTGMTCIASDGITLGQPCSGLTCASGLGCFNGSCRKYCLADSDCPLVAQARACMPTYWIGTKTAIPGVSVCAQVCDPVSPQYPRSPLQACPVGFGCGPSSSNPGASNCVPQPGYGISYSTCTGIFDCAPGYYCTNSGICAQFCYSDLDCMESYETCHPFSPPAYASTYQVGYCY